MVAISNNSRQHTNSATILLMVSTFVLLSLNINETNLHSQDKFDVKLRLSQWWLPTAGQLNVTYAKFTNVH